MATVLFVCLLNAGRSQMSEALFTRAAAGAHDALSAGTTPADHVHPEVVEVMRELDIDLADRCDRGILGDFDFDFDASGDTTSNQITLLRAERGGGSSTVLSYDGATIASVVRPPARLVR